MKNLVSRRSAGRSLEFLATYNANPGNTPWRSRWTVPLLIILLILIVLLAVTLVGAFRRIEQKLADLEQASNTVISTLEAPTPLPIDGAEPESVVAEEPLLTYKLEIKVPGSVKLKQEEITVLVTVKDESDQPIPQFKPQVTNNALSVGTIENTEIITDPLGLAAIKIRLLSVGFLNLTIAAGQVSQQVIVEVGPNDVAYYLKNVPALQAIDADDPYFSDIHTLTAKTKIFLLNDKSVEVELKGDVRAFKIAEDAISGLSIVIIDLNVASTTIPGLLPGAEGSLKGIRLRDVASAETEIFTIPAGHKQPILLLQSESTAGYALIRLTAFVEESNFIK